MGDNKTFADLFSDVSSDDNKNEDDKTVNGDNNVAIQSEDIENENSKVFKFNEIFSSNEGKNINFTAGDNDNKILENENLQKGKVNDDNSLNLGQNLFFYKDNSDLIKDNSNVTSEGEVFETNKGDNIFLASSQNDVKNLDSSVHSNNNIFNDEQEGKNLQKNIFFDSKSSDSNQIISSNVDNEDNSDTLVVKSKFSSLKETEKKSESVIQQSVSPFFSENLEDNQSNFDELSKINLIENEKNTKKTNSVDLSNSKHYSVKIVKKKEPLFKFILGVISYAIFIWLLLVGIALLVYVLDIKIRASKGDYSSPTFNAYVVLTGSMLPEIQVNDVVVTKKVDASSLKVGDVITFASADTRFLNTIITHRIIKKEYDSKTKTYSFQTQGDNNNVADSVLVPQSNIYGKVILKIPKLGYLQEFLASDGGWIIVILIPCLTVISYDVVKLAKGLKKKKYKSITIQK